MCLIIAFAAVFYAVSAFSAGSAASGAIAAAVALFFTGLLVKNVMDVKRMRSDSKEES